MQLPRQPRRYDWNGTSRSHSTSCDSSGCRTPAANPPAAPAASPAAPVSEVPKSYLAWMVEASGPFGACIAIESFVLVALVTMNLLQLRREAFVPSQLADDFEALLQKREYQEAYDLARKTIPSKNSDGGMARVSKGYDDAVEGMNEVVEEESMHLDHKLSYIGLIVTTAPMLGLLGTVQGMIEISSASLRRRIRLQSRVCWPTESPRLCSPPWKGWWRSPRFSRTDYSAIQVAKNPVLAGGKRRRIVDGNGSLPSVRRANSTSTAGLPLLRFRRNPEVHAMRMKRFTAPDLTIDMTPMIDCTFQLITFFMLVINFESSEADERIKLPENALARPAASKFEDEIVLQIAVIGEGEEAAGPEDVVVLYSGEELPLSAMEDRMARERRFYRLNHPEGPIHHDNRDPRGTEKFLMGSCRN